MSVPSDALRLVSPDELFAEAKKFMLHGKEPKSWADWCRVMNFFAFNVDTSVAYECCRILAILFEMPLSEEDTRQIVEWQLTNRPTHDGQRVPSGSLAWPSI